MTSSKAGSEADEPKAKATKKSPAKKATAKKTTKKAAKKTAKKTAKKARSAADFTPDHEGHLLTESREKFGSRDARKLRGRGRVPISLQSVGDQASLNLHIDTHKFLASRRHHVHLYDLDVEGETESALVRELQWDALGDTLLHIEFKRVQRGVETEVTVPLEFAGHPKDGVLNHLITDLPIKTIPSNIPDMIEVNVDGLETGQHIKAGDLELPEGVSLSCSPDLEIAVVSILRAEVEEVPVDGEVELGEGLAEAPEDSEDKEEGGNEG